MLGFAGTRQWVYPQSVTGRWQRLRRAAFLLLHAWLFLTPWLSVGGNPAFRIDLPGRTLYAFGGVFTPRDTILLMLGVMFLAFTLFFVTSLWGRIWCGYACPQTVFLETLVRPIEQFIEGNRTTRMRRDQAGFSLDLAWRKAAKWTAFAAVALLVAGTFLSWFVDPRLVWTGRAPAGGYGVMAFFAFLMFVDFTWFREQFCTYVCPYARFQSVMTDADSLMVGYDGLRGEPRNPKLGKSEGRCVDCNKCVVVCPAGIDIRNGFQLECIQCARCVDACESVMGRLGHPTLVEYTTLRRARREPARKWRPRTAAYTTLLTGLAAAMTLVVVNRTPIEASVQRAPGSLFTVDDDGYVRNTYLLRVTNTSGSHAKVPYHVHVDGLPDAQVICDQVELASTESATLPLVVRVPARGMAHRTTPIRVRVISPTDTVKVDATFKSGGAE